jgi:signal transduction histidine kinase
VERDPTQILEPPVQDGARGEPRFAPDARAAPSAAEGDAAPPSGRRLLARLRLSQWVLIIVSVLAAVLVAGVILGASALSRESDARHEIIEQLDPARAASMEFGTAIVAQRSGIRGYILNGLQSNLREYRDSIAAERRAAAEIRRLTASLPGLAARIAAVERAAQGWRREFAEPAIERVRRGGAGQGSAARGQRAAVSFGRVSSDLAALRSSIADRREDALARLSGATDSLAISFYAIAGALALALIGVAATMRRAITRPLERLADHARVVARGDLEHHVAGDGPADLVALAADVDSMRRRILRDLHEVRDSRLRLQDQARDLERKAAELARSNDELEQFAYIASHDLQEPLRKVASFCQLLQRQYAGQLDERAEEYIEYAVDGAKRMQVLISDLLSFSRVGRMGTEMVDVALGDAARTALDNLTRRVDETKADVEIGPLPVVLGEPALLTTVFQNLIGNALKFHGDGPPVVRVRAERDGDMWLISCSDSGIGIAPEYAERIFAIFQRLHPKETYEGTGLGLALVRKIVEHHGGRIWLDTSDSTGTTFRFTLPAKSRSPSAEPPGFVGTHSPEARGSQRSGAP